MADNAPVYSKFLFLAEDGRPLHFYMTPCEERKRLRPLIEYGGGTISAKLEDECIILAVPGQRVRGPDLINSRYVHDCVKKNQLLNIDNYRVIPDTTAKKDEDEEDDSDMEPADNIIRLNSSKRGRAKYSANEDMKIISYILKNRLYRETTGTSVWKTLEFNKVTDHTWQSMKDHFRKIIIPNVEKYMLSPREVALLTGTVVKADPGESPGIVLYDDDENPPPPKKSKSAETSTRAVSTKSSAKTSKYFLNLDDFDRELIEKALPGEPTKSDTSESEEDGDSDGTSSKKARKEKKDGQGASRSDKTQNEGRVGKSKEKGGESVKNKEKVDVVEIDDTQNEGEKLKSSAKGSKGSNVKGSKGSNIKGTKGSNVKGSKGSLGSRTGRKAMEDGGENSDDSNSTDPLPSTSAVQNKRGKTSLHVPLKDFVEHESFSQPVIPSGVQLETKRKSKGKKKCKKEPAEAEKKLIEARKMMKHVTGWLNVTNEELLSVLWMTSGAVEEAISWVKGGGRDDDLIWQPADDRDLKSGDTTKLQTLNRKYGVDAVQLRQSFLRGYWS